MTRRELVDTLRAIGSDEAESEARIILEELFSVSYSMQFLETERDYSSDELSELVSKRAKRIPLQYILGYAYFCSEKYMLCDDCLIPRADTELLVEKAAKLLPCSAEFADLCTGSGCIAISLLCARPDTRATAIDISEGAVKMAIENAKLNKVIDRIDAGIADIFCGCLADRVCDAIISNPPYIPTEVISGLSPEVQHEPVRALDGGADGMDFYRFILKNYQKNLKADGFFAFEIGYDQKQSITELAISLDMKCEVLYDLGGNPRVAIIKREA